MQKTSNYNLNKPEQTDVVNIEDLNANFDILDSEIKKVSDKVNLIQIAGGTGTALTLANVSLVNGFTVSFIAAANNNGAATTINGKPLYKPGTTTAPKLTAGKAATVWYDTASGGRFFIKASAEGNATAENVLAGKIFSSDEDTGITGTMPDLRNITTGIGAAGTIISVEDDPAYPGQHSIIEFPPPTYGYVTSATKLRQRIANLQPHNIKTGVKIGGTEAGITGTFTSDADAVAGNILNGKTAYVKGNKIAGNIPSKSAATITPSTTDQVIASGQYLSGAQTIKGDVNLIPENIKDGVTIFGKVGTHIGGVTEIFNFPLSIQNTQPTPVRNGHIWVKSTQGASITKVRIVEALNAGEENGTLMLVVGDLAYRNFTTFHNKTTTDGFSKSISVEDSNTTNDWMVQSLSGVINSTTYIKRPIVYSKINGVLDIETAYMWNGSTWVMLSQKGSYIVLQNTQDKFRIYNYNGDTNDIILHSEITLYTSAPYITAYNTHFSSNGEYLVVGRRIYKRVGDIFTLYFTVPTTIAGYYYSTIYGDICSLSADGSILVAPWDYSNKGFVVYKNNGSTFIQSQVISFSNNSTTQGYMQAHVSNNGKYVLLSYSDADDTWAFARLSIFYADADGNYSTASKTDLTRTYEGHVGGISVMLNPFDEKSFMVSRSGDVFIYEVNLLNKTCAQKVSYTYDSPAPLGFLTANIALYKCTPGSTSTYYSVDLSNNQSKAVTMPVDFKDFHYEVTANKSSTKVITKGLNYQVNLLNCNIMGNDVSFSLIKKDMAPYLYNTRFAMFS